MIFYKAIKLLTTVNSRFTVGLFYLNIICQFHYLI